MATIIARAESAAHWYKLDGAPQYTVLAKDGSERATTLRDARSMNLVPSVTTILQVASKPGLEQWKLEQMLLSALTLPKLPDESEKTYIARIVADSKETAKQAANAGTRIHESIEQWFDGKETVEHQEIAELVEIELKKHFGTDKWMVEKSFAHPDGFGGKVDLHCGRSDKIPDGIVVDIKTKDFGPKDKIEAYSEHLMQLSAYRQGLGMPNARCANLFVSRTTPGLMKMIEWSEDDLTRGWQMFGCLLNYWKLKTGMK